MTSKISFQRLIDQVEALLRIQIDPKCLRWENNFGQDKEMFEKIKNNNLDMGILINRIKQKESKIKHIQESSQDLEESKSAR